MHYVPDVGWHGVVRNQDHLDPAAQTSLTLCTPDTFGRWSASPTLSMFEDVARTPAFAWIAIRNHNDPTVEVRCTSHSVWLEPGEVPAQRRDWHVDRVGSLVRQDGKELVDHSDPLSFQSFLVSGAFLGADANQAERDAVSTQFVLSELRGSASDSGIESQEMNDDILAAMATETPKVVQAGDRAIVGFSPRTVHRQGVAVVSGWRHFVRIGLYTATEPCSPYQDHFVCTNPVLDTTTSTTRFRRAGTRDAPEEGTPWSLDLTTRSDEVMGRVREWGLLPSGEEGIRRVHAAIDHALRHGRQLLGE